MDIKGAVVLVTGANRGIGAEFVEQLKRRGAAKVYAAARDVGTIEADGVHPLELDVTSAGQIAAAAAAAGDVQVLINNAGISTGTPLVSGDEAMIRREMETNFYGPLLMTRAFAPVLGANGGGAIVNLVSALSWFTTPTGGAYAASKAATWMLTDSTRLELAAQGTHVVGVHMGLVDTDMVKGMDAPKIAPSELANAALDAIESGEAEVLGDDWARFIKSGLALEPMARYEQIFGALGA
ncbi:MULTISPECIES: SDR family oxidoreductase [Aeromicrobium]|uniref:SDR family NAD(P)-dependent oxidoreductase n=1 Tax=Aeromicrobium yanjiei TaxID=2662028 RepID=A0A5Q2MGZ7_9ACTN|nr:MULTISPECIES: SDR family oxidoreductase [Aeromicrobium]MRK02251.1 SDR family NAD(P)-dependent oxidoreductase [Aeromicrobium sp. S22]QGG41029.1 SDR family NAD(P)-dependent oxidoreductase [Aeromicrobium yanjiei]